LADRSATNSAFGRAASKGQAVPLDFVAGLFIFMVLLAYFVIIWDIYSTRYIEHGEGGNLETHAISIAETLVSSPGHPFNWTLAPLEAQSAGLASRPNRLDTYRIAALESMPYAYAKRLLGTDSDFLIKIESPEGARYSTIGHEAVNSTRIVEVTRIATYNGAPAFVKVQLYE